MLPWLQIYSFFAMKGTFMGSLSAGKHADIIDAFNTTSRYFGDILT